MSIGEKIAATLSTLIVGPMILAILWMMFFIFPTAMFAGARCLEAGYPTAHVTWNLKKYCSNLSGSVTVQVDEIK